MMKSFLNIGWMLALLLFHGCTTNGATIQEFTNSLHGAHVSRLFPLWGRPDYSGSVNGEAFVAWETDLTAGNAYAITSTEDEFAVTINEHTVSIPRQGGPPTTSFTRNSSDYCRIRVFLDAGDRILFSDVEESFLGCSDYPIPLGWLADGEW